MLPTVGLETFLFLAPPLILILLAALWQMRRHEMDLESQRIEIGQRIYESLILREIGERIGYELNIGKVLETIVTSLTKLLSFSAASYMLISPDKTSVDFRVHLEESVNQGFLDAMRDHMLDALNKISPKPFTKTDLKPMVTGTIKEEKVGPVGSLWIAPLVINERGIGLVAVASKKTGLYQGPEMAILIQILDQANRAVNNLDKVIANEQGKLNSMVNSMADGVLMLDGELNLLVINPAAVSLLGLAPNTKPTIFDIAKVLAGRVSLQNKIQESNTADTLVTVEDILIGDRVSRLLITPVKDRNQNRLGTVVTFHDRTAQKQLERLRDEFTAMMVHELRAPLTVVRGAADMFLKNPPLASEAKGQELLKTVTDSTQTMLSLVNDLLDAAKIEAGKFQISKTLGNFVEVANEQVAFFTQLAAQKSITLSADFVDPSLPVQLDRDRMSQVLGNLLSNAIKNTSAGGKITVSAYKVSSAKEVKWRFGPPERPVTFGPSLLVTVSDTGSGIAAERIPELFSRFRQLHAVDNETGTGLGLAIAKGIIESHGGVIFLESRLNEGTVFYFTIPLGS